MAYSVRCAALRISAWMSKIRCGEKCGRSQRNNGSMIREVCADENESDDALRTKASHKNAGSQPSANRAAGERVAGAVAGFWILFRVGMRKVSTSRSIARRRKESVQKTAAGSAPFRLPTRIARANTTDRLRDAPASRPSTPAPRAISSVVERLLHTQEVAGSNPASRKFFPFGDCETPQGADGLRSA